MPVLVLEQDRPCRPRRRQLCSTTHPDSVAISAAKGEGSRAARARSATGCGRSRAIAEFVVPYERGDVLAALHRAGEVLVEVHDETGDAGAGPAARSGRGHFAEFTQ